MRRKRAVLWIEDGARIDLNYLAAPMNMDGRFDLVIAEDVSSAVVHLFAREFEAIVVDVRLPPGKDPLWVEFFWNERSSWVASRLGLRLLYSLLKPDEARVRLRRVPSWIGPERVGVFTVESFVELSTDLEKLGIRVYRQKTASMSYRVLVDITEEILHQSSLAT